MMEDLDKRHFQYFGEKTPKLDVKLRFALPVCFHRVAQRRSSESEVILFRDAQNQKIIIYDSDTFSKKINVAGEDLGAGLGYAANLVQIDAQGRILLGKAGIKTLFDNRAKRHDITVVGCVDYLEVWATKVWNEVKPARNEGISRMLDKLAAITLPSDRGQSRIDPEPGGASDVPHPESTGPD